ncbi:prostaglandin reductase 1-like [Trichogramma pretiosum]|uniref:prostaglandin reductase 1-like n=1 Tax=Trichogramma pretiosum TaxID=7493 RepID=UPI0006C94FB9|nr:prostaglandin reductase 1-like [Trichogramma pretiosum]
MIARKWVINKPFFGLPQESDVSIIEEPLEDLRYGDVLAKAEYISVDPYQHPIGSQMAIGTTMIGLQVALVLESKNPDWKVGDRMVACLGWRDLSVFDPSQDLGYAMMKHKTYRLPELGPDLPSSLALGMLGLPGNAAYFVLKALEPKAGETLVVSSAAGAVGSHVGQMAKIYGLKVVGVAGSDEKCRWLLDDLGFDRAVNYKSCQDLAAALRDAAPDGFDCYFDNVGGEISSCILGHMKEFGRIAVCGSTSCYNHGNIWRYELLPKCPTVQDIVSRRQLRMQGFFVSSWEHRWCEGINQTLAWLRQGRLKYKECLVHGFDNTFQAFVKMLKGEHMGKTIVKVS